MLSAVKKIIPFLEYLKKNTNIQLCCLDDLNDLK